MMKQIFSVDIGGTNSRFGHFEVKDNGALSLIGTTWLATRDASSFEDLLESLVRGGFSLRPDTADIIVIAIAGPVEQGMYSAPPLIEWDLDLSDAGNRFGFKSARMINDYVAQAFACRSPVADAAALILAGEAVPDATIAVIGAGTGLGKAALAPDGGGGFIAVPSEGAHANFPVITEDERSFHGFLAQETGEEQITANMVVSGRGLSSIHRFLTGETLEPREVAKTFSHESATLAWAARFYGRACRNYALEVLARGGVYIAGGIAAQEPAVVRHEAFEREFRASTTMARILEKIPVFLITDRESGLWGAAIYGRQVLMRGM